MVSFFFGPRVQIPDDNVNIGDEQCFEIGLDCTVIDHEFLVDRRTISFSAFVETDNNVRTVTRSVSLRVSPTRSCINSCNHNYFFQIVEPFLSFSPFQPTVLYDAGDSVPAVVTVVHQSNTRLTSAFRYNHSYLYSTEFFFFNSTDPNTAIFLYASIPLENFTARLSISTDMGTVVLPVDEKEALITIIPIIFLLLTDEVVYRETYTVPFEAVWHSLPYGHTGGRSYSHMGTITYSIRNLEIDMVQTTSNVRTLNLDLQLQEIVFCNVTVTFPEVLPSC